MKRLLIALAACGSGVNTNNDRCGASGSGSVIGTTMGMSLGPIARAVYTSGGGNFGIVLSEQPGKASVCDMTPAVDTGLMLAMVFCAPVAAGHFDAVAEADFNCPSGPLGLVEEVTGRDTADGRGGTIDITSTDDGCVEGTFSLELDNGQDSGNDTLTGSFAALSCVE